MMSSDDDKLNPTMTSNDDDDDDLEPTSTAPTVNDAEAAERQKYVRELLEFIQSQTLDFSSQFEGGANFQRISEALTMPMMARLVQCCGSRLSFVANARVVWNDEARRNEMFAALGTAENTDWAAGCFLARYK